VSAPAAATAAMLSDLIPPSTSSRTARAWASMRARAALIFASVPGMND